MNKKRIAALLLAVLMLLALFSACAQEKTPDDSQKGVTAPDDNPSDENTPDDAPVEADLHPFKWLGRETAQWPHPMEEACEFETWKMMLKALREDYLIDYSYDTVYDDAYSTTLNGLIASNMLPDGFNAQGILDDSTFNSLIESGKLAPLDDVLEYSDGSSKEYYNTDGQMLYLKSWAMTADGNWYHVRSANSVGMAIDFSTPKYDMRAPGQVHGVYSMNIRQDWLDKLGIAMPTTTDEFFEAVSRFQDEDVNANGAADERVVVGLGEKWQTQGIGQWFGLPWEEFMEDPSTGVVEVSVLCDGYEEFVTYMNNLYSKNLVAVEGAHPWSTYAPLVGGNYVSAIHMMPDYIWSASTGDENSLYQPMPVIQAVDGIEPRVLIQESVAANNGFSFSAGCDYQAAASLLDYVNSKEFFMLYEYGIEGIAYDWNDDGESLTIYTLDDSQDGYASPRTQFLNGNGLPNPANGNLHDVKVVTYQSAQEALDAGEPYTEIFTTQAEWQEEFGADKNLPSYIMLGYLSQYEGDYHPAAYYSYRTLANNEELEILTTYQTDLTTYLMELTTSLIVGNIPVSNIETQIQYMYDNLGFQEYYNVMQARINRYLVAMGRDAVEIAE